MSNKLGLGFVSRMLDRHFLVGSLLILSSCAPSEEAVVRYGITPYQDSALPVVAERLGWYDEEGLTVELVPLVWGEVVTALSGGAVDVAVYNFNSFLPPYNQAAMGGRKPVFYCPFYTFKGQAIMVWPEQGYRTMEGEVGAGVELSRDVLEMVASQLRGKEVVATEGTELEQMVRTAMEIGGLSDQEVTIIHATPEDALAAFLAHDVDAFAAGLTERVEARRHGAVELLVTSDLGEPVIDGLVTTEEFAVENPRALEKLVDLWFKTIRYMEEDVEDNSVQIREYLAGAASTRYSAEEYAVAWTFNDFPDSRGAAHALFNVAESEFYWRDSWDRINEFLLREEKIAKPVPHSAYWGDQILGKQDAERGDE